MIRMTLVSIAAATLTVEDGRAATPDPHPPTRPLVFGVVPQHSATHLTRLWAPVVEALAAEMGRPVRLRLDADVPTFEACLAAGAYDIAYMNPYHYTEIAAPAGYRAVARHAGARLRGLVVAGGDAPGLAGLHGQEIAMPAPNAFGASLLVQAELRARGIEARPVFVSSHDSVYRVVAAGMAPAGGGVTRTFRMSPEEVRSDLRLVHQTAAYSPHAFALRIPLPDVEVSAALTGVPRDVWRHAGLPNGLESARDAAWNDVRALELHSLAKPSTASCPSA